MLNKNKFNQKYLIKEGLSCNPLIKYSKNNYKYVYEHSIWGNSISILKDDNLYGKQIFQDIILEYFIIKEGGDEIEIENRCQKMVKMVMKRK